MADRGKWLKLWLDSLTDLDTAGMTNEDWGFLTRLWMLIKKEGENGSITLERPATIPCALLHVTEMCNGECNGNVTVWDSLIELIRTRIPPKNVTVDVTIDNRYMTISFSKWLKYQGDWSSERVQKFRENRKNVTANVTVASSSYSSSSSSSLSSSKNKKEAKKSTQNGLHRFDEFWTAYPRKEAKGNAEKAWKSIPDETKDLIISVLPKYKFSPESKYIPLPASWLNGKRWEDKQQENQPLVYEESALKRLLRTGKI